MIVEDQLDRGAGRIGGIEKLEELDELAAAVTISDQGMDLAAEQINSRQQTERAMASVFVVTGEAGVDTRRGGQIRRSRRDSLDSRLFVIRDDRCPLTRLPRFSRGLFQNLDLAIDTQNFCHLLLEFSVAAFQVVAHLVRLDFLLAKNLANRALHQSGQASVPRRWPMFARVARQQPRRPQLVRVAVLLGLVARQGYQPGLGLQRDHRLFAWAWSVIQRRQRTIGHRPLDAALHGLMMRPKTSRHRQERWVLAVSEKHPRALPPARRLRSRTRYTCQLRNLLLGHRQLDRTPPSHHHVSPR